MPEAASTVCAFSQAQIEYAREHAIEFAGIKKQAFAGGAEIKLGSFDNHSLELAPAAAWALAATFAKLQIENGIEYLVYFSRIFASSYQVVQ